MEIDDQVTGDTATSRQLDMVNGIHNFRVRAINGLGNTGGWSERLKITVDNALSTEYFVSPLPDRTVFVQNYPNPFGQSTTFKFTIPVKEKVTLEIFSMNGMKVAMPVQSILEPGSHNVHFSAAGLTAGVYFYRFTVGNASSVRKMAIIR